MKRNVSRKSLKSLCGQLGPDDGVDPREYFKPASSRRNHRKDWQLCRQVVETLNYVLSGDCSDDVLQGLVVQSAEPAPNASNILVTVAPSLIDDTVSPAQILERLQAVSRRLRSEVAMSISRRRAPELSFRVALSSSVSPMRESVVDDKEGD